MRYGEPSVIHKIDGIRLYTLLFKHVLVHLKHVEKYVPWWRD